MGLFPTSQLFARLAGSVSTSFLNQSRVKALSGVRVPISPPETRFNSHKIYNLIENQEHAIVELPTTCLQNLHILHSFRPVEAKKPTIQQRR
jgi:hypothetical protein